MIRHILSCRSHVKSSLWYTRNILHPLILLSIQLTANQSLLADVAEDASSAAAATSSHASHASGAGGRATAEAAIPAAA